MPINLLRASIGKLTVDENHWKCSPSMTVILQGIKSYEIVVIAVSPADDADTPEVDAYEHLYHTASTIFVQVLSEEILQKIVILEIQHLLWTCLRTEYY